MMVYSGMSCCLLVPGAWLNILNVQDIINGNKSDFFSSWQDETKSSVQWLRRAWEHQRTGIIWEPHVRHEHEANWGQSCEVRHDAQHSVHSSIALICSSRHWEPLANIFMNESTLVRMWTLSEQFQALTDLFFRGKQLREFLKEATNKNVFFWETIIACCLWHLVSQCKE